MLNSKSFSWNKKWTKLRCHRTKIPRNVHFWGLFLYQRPLGTSKLALYTHSETQFSTSSLMLTKTSREHGLFSAAFTASPQDQTTWLFRTLRKPETERFRTEKYTKQSGKQSGSVNSTNREAERQSNLKGATSLPACRPVLNSDF